MTTLANLFAVDLRSLALLRMGLATLLLVDLADRAVFLQAHYTDFGIFPRVDAALLQDTGQWSLHLLTGRTAGQALLFAIAAVLALLLLLGWRTRIVTIASWVLLVSLQARTPPVAYGADGVLRALMFYSMFLPLGARWSIDDLFSAKDVDTRRPDTHRSIAATALTLQIAVIYVLTGVQKLGDPSWLRLEAVFFALASDHHATTIGLWLSRFPTLMEGLTVATLLLEIVGPLLLFVPIARSRVRLVLIAAFVFFHVVLGLCLHLGLFSWVSILAWLALLPREAWERAGIATRAGVDVDRPTPRRRVASALVLLGLMLAGLAGLDHALASWTRPSQLRTLAQAFGLEQRWNMFIRPMHDGWLIASATSSKGELDLLRDGAPVSFDRPKVIEHKSMRWRKYFGDLTFDRSKRNRVMFLRYLCTAWNDSASDDEKVTSVDLIFMQVDDRPDGTESPIARKILASRRCDARDTAIDDSAEYFEMKPGTFTRPDAGSVAVYDDPLDAGPAPDADAMDAGTAADARAANARAADARAAMSARAAGDARAADARAADARTAVDGRAAVDARAADARTAVDGRAAMGARAAVDARAADARTAVDGRAAVHARAAVDAGTADASTAGAAAGARARPRSDGTVRGDDRREDDADESARDDDERAP